jgi:hypothetical protein
LREFSALSISFVWLAVARAGSWLPTRQGRAYLQHFAPDSVAAIPHLFVAEPQLCGHFGDGALFDEPHLQDLKAGLRQSPAQLIPSQPKHFYVFQGRGGARSIIDHPLQGVGFFLKHPVFVGALQVGGLASDNVVKPSVEFAAAGVETKRR